MSDPRDTRIREEAIAWHVRLDDASADQWNEFAQWLEADPRHNSAYEAVADDDAFLESALSSGESPGPAANDDPPGEGGHRWKIWRWPALAASIALVAGLTFVIDFGGGRDRYEIATQAGESRLVVLEEGSSVKLNGETRIELDRDDARYAQLLSGEARFDVRHDRGDPFTVHAGDQRIVDAGTIFNIVLSDEKLSLDVAEGAVHYEGYGKSIDLAEGASLIATSGGELTLGEKPTAIMASWTRNELVYRGATLEEVASDLHRLSGVSITVSPDIAERRFSGVIQTKGEREKLRGRLETLLDVRIIETGNGWTLEP